MEENQLQPTDDDFTSFAPGLSREQALTKRWGRVATHAVRRQVFELLSKEPGRQMYLAEIARALGKDYNWVRAEIRHFVWTKVVEEEKRSGRTYYRLRPGMVEQYQQWLASQQQPDEPEP